MLGKSLFVRGCFVLLLIGCQPAQTATHGTNDIDLHIRQMIEERGDPILVVANGTALLLAGLPPAVLEQAGISIHGDELVIHPSSGGEEVYRFAYVRAPQALLEYALELQDSGDPVKITYRYSECLTPVTCRVDCHQAGLNFFAKETPIKDPKRCKRIEEDKICTDTLAAVCTRQLYFDNRCTRPVNGPFDR
ncbi:MAG: hypothetical protein ACRD1T_24910, partial [Acidimicrobiia bacterium]